MNKQTNLPLIVSIRCLAYNHEKFIRDTLEGFVMQKTNFSFEAIVHDDASTDGTAEIIREYAEKYPDIIKPIYETENQYSKKDGSLSRIMNDACKGKYIAFCEGDDYWTDPYKLQKQVDILEANNDITLVYTNFDTVDEINKRIDRPYYEHLKKRSKSGNVFYDLLLNGNCVMTLTAMYRKEIFSNKILKEAPYSLDYMLTLIASGLGNVFYINEVTGCYRKNSKSLLSTQGEYIGNLLVEIKYYIEYLYIKGNFRKLSFCEDYKVKADYIEFSFSRMINKKKIEFDAFIKKPSMLLYSIPVLTKYILIKFIRKLYGKYKTLVFI